jgi:hypothetical protein
MVGRGPRDDDASPALAQLHVGIGDPVASHPAGVSGDDSSQAFQASRIPIVKYA